MANKIEKAGFCLNSQRWIVFAIGNLKTCLLPPIGMNCNECEYYVAKNRTKYFMRRFKLLKDQTAKSISNTPNKGKRGHGWQSIFHFPSYKPDSRAGQINSILTNLGFSAIITVFGVFSHPVNLYCFPSFSQILLVTKLIAGLRQVNPCRSIISVAKHSSFSL